MKLITNRISTGKAKRFEDFVADFRKKNIKTASVKTAEQEEADSSGQLDVEPLHQEGESTTMPKAGPSAKKDDGEKTSSATKKNDEEGPDSGQPKAEGSEKFTNDPKVPSKEEKAGSVSNETKVARNRDRTGPEGEGPRTGRGCGPCKDDDDDDDDKKDKKTKEAGSLPEALKEHMFKKKDDKGDDDDGGETKPAKDDDDADDDDKEAKSKDDDKEEKESSKKVEFVKVANLDEKNKGFLKEYWRQLFGDDYVNAIIADK